MADDDEHDVPDPDEVRGASARLREVFGNFETYADLQAYAISLVDLIIGILTEMGGEVRLPLDYETVAHAAPRLPYIDKSDPAAIVVRLVDDPPSEQAQAVLDGGPDWIRASSGQAVKVTGADGEMVVFVIEEAPGRWSDPERYHADCFLRDHVLAAGVPLL